MLQSRNNKKRKFSSFMLAEFCLTEREKAKKKKIPRIRKLAK